MSRPGGQVIVSRVEYDKLKHFYSTARNGEHVTVFYSLKGFQKEIRTTKELKEDILRDLELIHKENINSIAKLKKMSVWQFIKWRNE